MIKDAFFSVVFDGWWRWRCWWWRWWWWRGQLVVRCAMLAGSFHKGQMIESEGGGDQALRDHRRISSTSSSPSPSRSQRSLENIINFIIVITMFTLITVTIKSEKWWMMKSSSWNCKTILWWQRLSKTKNKIEMMERKRGGGSLGASIVESILVYWGEGDYTWG